MFGGRWSSGGSGGGAASPVCIPLGMANNGSLGAGVTTYFGGAVGSSVTEGDKELAIAAAVSLTTLAIKIGTAMPAGTANVFTVRKNGVDTGIVLTIPGGSAAGVYSAVGAAVAFAVGDRLSIRCVSGTGGTGNLSSGMIAS